MRLTRRACTLFLAAALAGQVATAPAHAAGPAAPGSLTADFARAAAEFDVPRDLLVAVAYGESRLDGHDGLPSQANGYGVMHLVSNPTQHSLERAATLTGEPVDRLRSVTSANVRGGAAVLRDLADDEGLTGGARDRLSAWYPVVARYSAAVNASTARLYADHVYDLLRAGIAAGPVRVAAQPLRPDLGRYADVAPAGAAGANAAAAVPEYAPARWVSAYSGNYQAGRSARITTVVVHVTQGSYAGTVSWFQNPTAGVSAHYVVKSSNGEITQMVREGDTAYHARSANPYAVGIEHEGFVDNPAWFTDAMYRSSAALTRYLCDKYGLPKTRAAIRGHNEMPGNDHTDPGPNWNWNYYISLVNAGGSGGRYLAGSPTDFTGDGRDDIVAFTHDAAGDVYVALSTGSSFAGTALKWHEYFSIAGEYPALGDVNGDGRDDIITFTQGPVAASDVIVALSTGASFGAAQTWHDLFAVGSELPRVGDINGDGRDDIVTFTCNAEADVYAAVSTGTSFVGTTVKWNDFFCLPGEFPYLGDYNGDGRDDVIAFTKGTLNDVYVGLSTGTNFLGGVKWHDFFGLPNETTL
ncbi:N-acetylmuramoyl-L-alanine amidase [Micromonospora inaquosa]|uniref:N-acetylmuramoyl-L-alanine amidase n=1 Tax=Micromonospora inaquosa TaxID=2203716 RepID=UPI0033D8E181